MTKFTKTFHFSAAHYLDNYVGKCGHIHGHNYILEVTVGTDSLFDDMVIESDKLKDLMKPLLDQLDHGFFIQSRGWFHTNVLQPGINTSFDLGEHENFFSNVIYLDGNPTTEIVAAYIHRWITMTWHVVKNVKPEFLQVVLRETPTIEVTV